VAEPDVPLSEDEVRQISRLIETLNASTFDYLQLEFGDLKLTLAKGGQGLAPAAAAVASAPPSAVTVALPMPTRARPANDAIRCPRCADTRVEQVSRWGSTPCKSHYRCLACREPFDYFKPY
jgi:hypothetical protein